MTREEAIDILQEEHDWCQEPSYVNKAIELAISALRSIDAVPVVRCGECRYWDEDGRCEPPQNGLIREYTEPNDFCSYGEWRDEKI